MGARQGYPDVDSEQGGGFQTASGLIVPSSSVGLAGVAAGAWASNQGKFIRFRPEEDIPIARLAIAVTTLDAADVDLSAAVYSSDLATRHLTTGAAALTGWSTSTGRKVLNFAAAATLRKGLSYWFGLALEGTTVQLLRYAVVNNANHGLIGTDTPNLRSFTMEGCVPMPAGGAVTPDIATSATAPYAALLTA
jgi:hypothetical protein